MGPEVEQMNSLARQGGPTLGTVQGLAVECVVFDQADRPKRRHLVPLAALLKPLSGPRTAGISGLVADAS